MCRAKRARGDREPLRPGARNRTANPERKPERELRAAELDSLLFPASVGREFAEDRTDSSAISDAYLTSPDRPEDGFRVISLQNS
jgi:hypothetical protein